MGIIKGLCESAVAVKSSSWKIVLMEAIGALRLRSVSLYERWALRALSLRSTSFEELRTFNWILGRWFQEQGISRSMRWRSLFIASSPTGRS